MKRLLLIPNKKICGRCKKKNKEFHVRCVYCGGSLRFLKSLNNIYQTKRKITRIFFFITQGKLVDLLHGKGLDISRGTLLTLEKKKVIPKAGRMQGKWRVYSEKDVENIFCILKKYYRYS